jgi:hypothetical protein
MEVHHHPKHAKEPRNLKEYLFEFLVIFIAITGSYFAENLREHYVDKHSVKEYMAGILTDLKTDASVQRKILARNEEQLKGLDSLLQTMREGFTGDNLDKFHYYDLKYTLDYNIFNTPNRTISLLKTTGDLRLIKNEGISRGISDYDFASEVVIFQAGLVENLFAKIADQQTHIIDLMSIKKNNPRSILSNQANFPALLTADKSTLHAYYFNLTLLRGVINSYQFKLNELNVLSSALIKKIRDEYSME